MYSSSFIHVTCLTAANPFIYSVSVDSKFKLRERGKGKVMLKFSFKAGFEPAVKSA